MIRNIACSALSVAVLGSLLTMPPAYAQDIPATTAATESYPASYFSSAAPKDAYDMVSRLPGFSIIEADADVRGYAAALGNVLIDGARPASKREDIGSLLKRIPASTVERVELIRSGAPGVDMGGYALLANVVPHRKASVESAFEAGAVTATDGWAAPALQWEYGRRADDSALEFSVKLQPELDDDTGRGTIRIDQPSNSATRLQQWDTRTVKDDAEANASWRRPLAGGRLTVTAALRGEQVRADSRMWSSTASDDDERIREREDSHEAELGARFVRSLGNNTTLELVALQQLGWLEEREHSLEGDDTERFAKSNDSGESIGRMELTHLRSASLSFNASLEGAFNFLASDSRLDENGTPTYLPGSRTRVEEKRAEFALGTTWVPRPDLSLDAGLTLETSYIAQTGDIQLRRSFRYPKPRLALRWDMDGNDQFRASLAREVGQLDFEDFAASASLDSDSVSAGNAQLQPDKTWQLAAAWEHTFANDGALTLGLSHDWITDVVDRVLVSSDDGGFDAPGNIGSGTRDTFSLDYSTPLEGIGLVGGRIRSALLWRNSRVTDPVTGNERAISEEKPFEGEIEISQDLAERGFSWGLLIEHIGERKTKYRFDEIKREAEGAGWTLYAEQRLGQRWRMRAEATDLFGRDFSESREKYDGPRDRQPVDEIELRQRRTPGYVSLAFRRDMGG